MHNNKFGDGGLPLTIIIGFAMMWIMYFFVKFVINLGILK